jgi:hypothetical protein
MFLHATLDLADTMHREATSTAQPNVVSRPREQLQQRIAAARDAVWCGKSVDLKTRAFPWT